MPYDSVKLVNDNQLSAGDWLFSALVPLLITIRMVDKMFEANISRIAYQKCDGFGKQCLLPLSINFHVP